MIKAILSIFNRQANVGLLVATGIISFVASSAFQLYTVYLNQGIDAKKEAVSSFELTATNFNTIFQKYAYFLIENKDVSQETKAELMSALTKQSSQLEWIAKRYPEVASEAETLDARLQSTQVAIASGENFYDLKNVYENVGPMLAARERFLTKFEGL